LTSLGKKKTWLNSVEGGFRIDFVESYLLCWVKLFTHYTGVFTDLFGHQKGLKYYEE